MKKLIFVMILIVNLMVASGQQIPIGISFQAVARNNQGEELKNKSLDVKFSILKGNANGEIVWQELHTVATNEFGLFTLTIGTEIKQIGTASSFSDIPWSSGPFYLHVEVKFDNSFIDMGTTQMLAVPYALYALRSGSSATGSQQLSLNTTDKTLDLSNSGGSIKVSDLTSLMQVDKDSTNEIQTLSLEGNILKIKHANTVDGSVTINSPALSLKGHVLSIENGNSITLPDSVNEFQNLSLTTNGNIQTLALSKANSVSFNVNDQDLYESRDTIYITKKTLPTKVDLTQKLTVDKQNNKLTIKRGNTVNIDTDPTNELITSSTFDGDKLHITEAGTDHQIDISALKKIPWVGFSCSYFSFGTLNMAASSEFSIPWTKDFDDSNNFSNNKFVIPSSGVYSFSISMLFSNSSDNLDLNIYNLTTKIKTFQELGTKSFSTSFLLKLNIGDIIEIKVENRSLSSAYNINQAVFTGYRVH